MPDGRRLAVIAALALIGLGACGTEGGGDGGDATCVRSGDRVRSDAPVVRVRIECSGDAFTADGMLRAVPGGTDVLVRSVSRDQRGQASIRLGHNAMCAFGQIRVAKPALLTIREPEGALFRQRRGESLCTIGYRTQTFCLDAIVEVGEVAPTQLRATCQRDPVLDVAVLAGTADVTLASGETIEIAPGQELKALPEPRIVEAVFTDRELGLFASQARALGFGPTPTPTPRPTPTVTVTETVTPSPTPPDNTVLPSVSWVEFQQIVRAEAGTWTGTGPLTFTYSWEVACNKDGSGCVPTGATGDTYELAGNRDCDFVRVVVTASNTAGSVPASSLPFDINCVD